MLYFAGPGGLYLNGAVLPVDGGQYQRFSLLMHIFDLLATTQDAFFRSLAWRKSARQKSVE